MRHAVAGYRLNRSPEHRMAMWRNMAVALFTHGQITTTLAKAKSLQPFVERLITWARKGDLASRRRVLSRIGDPIMIRSEDDPDVEYDKYGEVIGGPRVVKHLFDEIAPRFADRPGGYTRIIRLDQHRIGDASDLVVLQLLGEEESGPRVTGRYSRRRQKQNKRAAFAAKLRRGKSDPAESGESDESAVAEAEVPADAEAMAEAETPEASEEQAADEAAPETEVGGEDDKPAADEKKDG